MNSQRNRKQAILNPVNIDKKDKCEICLNKFQLTRTAHQCKRCFRSVCSECGQRQLIPGGDNQVHRLCNLCKKDMNKIEELKLKFSLKWGRDSDIGKNWAQQLGMDINKTQNDYNKIKQQLNYREDTSLNQSQAYKQLSLDLSAGRGSLSNFSYSFYSLLQNVYAESMEMNICTKNILCSIFKIYPEIGYSQYMIDFVCFLMCFCSESTTYGIVVNYYKKIVPVELLPESIENEIDDEGAIQYKVGQLVGKLSEDLSLQERNQYLIKDFLLEIYDKYYLSVFTNFFSVDVTMNLLSFVFKSKSFIIVDQLIQVVVLINFQLIIEKYKNFDYINEMILKYNTLQQFKQSLDDLKKLNETPQPIKKKSSKNQSSNQKQMPPMQQETNGKNTIKKEEAEKYQEQIAKLLSEIDRLKVQLIEKDDQINELKGINNSLSDQIKDFEYKLKENGFLYNGLLENRDLMEDKFLCQFKSLEQISQKIQQDQKTIQQLTNERDQFKNQAFKNKEDYNILLKNQQIKRNSQTDQYNQKLIESQQQYQKLEAEKEYYKKQMNKNRDEKELLLKTNDEKCKENIEFKKENLKLKSYIEQLKQQSSKNLSNQSSEQSLLLSQKQMKDQQEKYEKRIKEVEKLIISETKDSLDVFRTLGSNLEKINKKVKSSKLEIDKMEKDPRLQELFRKAEIGASQNQNQNDNYQSLSSPIKVLNSPNTQNNYFPDINKKNSNHTKSAFSISNNVFNQNQNQSQTQQNETQQQNSKSDTGSLKNSDMFLNMEKQNDRKSHFKTVSTSNFKPQLNIHVNEQNHNGNFMNNSDQNNNFNSQKNNNYNSNNIKNNPFSQLDYNNHRSQNSLHQINNINNNNNNHINQPQQQVDILQ